MVEIEEDREKGKTIKSNKSLYFLLPMIKINYLYYKHNVINSYISDRKNRPDINNYHIFLLTKKLDEKLRGIKTYKEHYEVNEGIMYVFKIPEEFEEDYLKFILGQYSQFSSAYKQQIIRLLPEPYDKRTEFKVIMKSPEAKAVIEEKVGQSIGDQEVFSIPNMEEEIYG